MRIPAGVSQAEGAALLGRLERLPFTRAHARVASILGLGTFFDSFDALILSVGLTAILHTLGAPLSLAGLLIAAGYVGQFVGAIGFGFVSERAGRKVAFVTASAIFGLLSLAAAFAWSIESLMALRLIQGIGLGAEVPVAAALFNEIVRARARGRIVMIYESVFVWGILAASLLGSLFLAVFAPELAWRYLFAIGAVPLLVSVWAYFRLPESPRWLVHRGDLDGARAIIEELEASARHGGALPTVDAAEVPVDAVRETPTRFGELLGAQYRRRTAILWATWFTTYFALWGFTTWAPTLFVNVGHFSPPAAALISAAITIGDLVAVYLAAATVDRLGRRFWFLTGYGIALVGGVFGIVTIGFLHVTAPGVLIAAVAIVLVGVNVNAPLLYMYNAELYPTRMRSFATMVGSSLRALAAIIAPIVLGLLVTGAGGIAWVFGVFSAVLLVGLLAFARFGPETKQQTLEELAS